MLIHVANDVIMNIPKITKAVKNMCSGVSTNGKAIDEEASKNLLNANIISITIGIARAMARTINGIKTLKNILIFSFCVYPRIDQIAIFFSFSLIIIVDIITRITSEIMKLIAIIAILIVPIVEPIWVVNPASISFESILVPKAI